MWFCRVHRLVYIFLGGLTSAIYNEVLQFFLIVLGFLPLVLLGPEGHRRLERAAAVDSAAWRPAQGMRPAPGAQSWRHLQVAEANPMGVEWFGMVMGLGFVLSFGYWCTDFLVVQRAMAAKSHVRGAAHAADRGDSEDAVSRFLVIVPGHDRDRV